MALKDNRSVEHPSVTGDSNNGDHRDGDNIDFDIVVDDEKRLEKQIVSHSGYDLRALLERVEQKLDSYHDKVSTRLQLLETAFYVSSYKKSEAKVTRGTIIDTKKVTSAAPKNGANRRLSEHAVENDNDISGNNDSEVSKKPECIQNCSSQHHSHVVPSTIPKLTRPGFFWWKICTFGLVLVVLFLLQQVIELKQDVQNLKSTTSSRFHNINKEMGGKLDDAIDHQQHHETTIQLHFLELKDEMNIYAERLSEMEKTQGLFSTFTTHYFWKDERSSVFSIGEGDDSYHSRRLDCPIMTIGSIYQWTIHIRNIGRGVSVGVGVASSAHQLDLDASLGIQKGGWEYDSDGYVWHSYVKQGGELSKFNTGDTVTLTLDLSGRGTLSASIEGKTESFVVVDDIIDDGMDVGMDVSNGDGFYPAVSGYVPEIVFVGFNFVKKTY